jgi:hypothetical protein
MLQSIPKPGIFISRIPSKATPRIMSMVLILSETVTGRAVTVSKLSFFILDERGLPKGNEKGLFVSIKYFLFN